MTLSEIKTNITTWWDNANPIFKGIVSTIYFPSDCKSRKGRWLFNIIKIICHIIFLLFLLILLVYIGAFGHIPNYAELRQINNNNASTIFSADNVQMGRLYRQNRISVDSADISINVVNALIATEDSRFFEHHGVDAQSTLRVLFKTLLMFDSSQGGGSTISQQLAKNLYPRKSYGILTYPVAKIKEIIIARRIERTYSKGQILTLYLNTVPFGENVYGIEAASQRFFSRKAKWLDPPTAATLVGMLAANTAYNPRIHPDQSLARRNLVLSRMAKSGYIDSLKLHQYTETPLQLKYNKVDNETGLGIFFRQQIAQEAQELLDNLYGEDAYNVFTDGLEIHTTINSRLQRYAESAVAAHMTEVQRSFEKDWKGRNPWGDKSSIYTRAYEQSERYKEMVQQGLPADTIKARMERPVDMILYTPTGMENVRISPADSVRRAVTVMNAGFLAVDPHTGDVVAWVGGINHRLSQVDHIGMRRQVGSTFKPIVYSAALESGLFYPASYIENVRRTYAGKWSPGNSDGKYGGWYSLKGALSKSLNTVSAYLIDSIKASSVVSLAHRLGIECDIPEVPSIALGTAEISLYEMVRAYQAFAASGEVHDLRKIVTIKDHDGKVLYRNAQAASEQVLSESTAIYVNDMMQAVVDSGTARSLRNVYKLTMPLAGKTGTTQNGSDGWFISVAPGLVAGAWVGCDNPSIRFRSSYYGQGAYMALPIVGRFLGNAKTLTQYTGGEFPAPLDEEMESIMSLPLYSEEEPDVEALLNDYYEDEEYSEEDEEENDRPVRRLFRNIFDRIFDR